MSIVVLEGSNGVGKTTIASKICQKYDIVGIKSVPNWFREYIDFARNCPLEIQKEIYKIGHDANYFSCCESKNYLLDRFVYSTIIRINYGLGRSVTDTIKEIASYENVPNLVFVIQAGVEEVKRRLNKRDGTSFDFDYYSYENQIFNQLSEKSDTMYVIDNNGNIDDTADRICHIMQSKIKVKKRSFYE